jgi:hypothetical protein
MLPILCVKLGVSCFFVFAAQSDFAPFYRRIIQSDSVDAPKIVDLMTKR